MIYTSPIDPHVHMRWTEYNDYDFAAKAMVDAKAVGLAAMIEMPNTAPALTTIQECQARRHHLNQLCTVLGCRGPERYIHIGITNDFAQIRRALEWITHRQNQYDFNKVELQDGLPIGDKTFYTHSTGNMGLLDENVQRQIWMLKSKMGYTGVSIGHFEDEKAFTGAFNYADPKSHSAYQNEEAEVVQVHRQLGNALDAGFKGTFYVAHVSSPETVLMATEFEKRQKPPFRLIMEATFHHLFLNTDDYEIHGNLVKMNPPLRSPKSQAKLLELALEDCIDILGTDHAPHPFDRKRSPTPPSGIPALPFWPKGIELLRKYGIKDHVLNRMLFSTAQEIFKLEVEPRHIEIEYNTSLWEKYGWNPFARVDGTRNSLDALSDAIYRARGGPPPAPMMQGYA